MIPKRVKTAKVFLNEVVILDEKIYLSDEMGFKKIRAVILKNKQFILECFSFSLELTKFKCTVKSILKNAFINLRINSFEYVLKLGYFLV